MRKRIETDQNGNDREVIVFEGKVLSIGENPISYGSNGNVGFPATVEFVDAKGNTVTRAAFIRKGNLDLGVAVGDKKLCTAAPTESGSFVITVSHLTYGGERASAEDFGALGAELAVAAVPTEDRAS